MTEETPTGPINPERPTPPQAPPAAPAPPKPQAHEAQVPTTSLVEYLRRRMEVMERELSVERDRTREAEDLLRQQDATRAEVDAQLKTLLEQLRQEKQAKESEESKSRARGRIDALEERLDEMHKTWAALLERAIANREAGVASADETGAQPAVESLRRDVAELREAFNEIPGKIAPHIRELKADLPDNCKRREEDERVLTENVRDIVSRLAQTVNDRLGELDRRMTLETEKHQQQLDALSRERTLLSQALDEERHRIRREIAKEQHALQSRFNEQLGEIAKGLSKLESGQENTDRETSGLKEAADKLREALSRPESAKEEIILELEQEKQDLMKALKGRTEQMRTYTMERREVERSLGESLMNLNRRLEEERAKQQGFESQIAGLNLNLQSLQGQLDLAKKAVEASEARCAGLGAERDELVKALMAEAEKFKSHLAARADAEQAWEERYERLERQLEEEKETRRSLEKQITDLRAQAQTLTDHITQTLREKEKIEGQAAGWSKEREELIATLRKKDEMVSMLSSAFQNIVKK